MDEFKVEGKTIRVVVHAFGEDGGRRPELVKRVERIVRAQFATMGLPDFDSYVFLFHFDPTARRGDGMEHLNSTQIVETGKTGRPRDIFGAISTASHEFFHVWNVKRLRPAGLGPWDFTRPVVTRGLWIAEGFTNYYGTMHEHRAGLLEEDEVYENFSGTITRVENSPGNRLMSAEESSVTAPFIDRSTHDQQTNLANSSISYYPKGETLGLALDPSSGRTKGRPARRGDAPRLPEVYSKAERQLYSRGADTRPKSSSAGERGTGLDLSSSSNGTCAASSRRPTRRRSPTPACASCASPCPVSARASLRFARRAPAHSSSAARLARRPSRAPAATCSSPSAARR